MDWTYTWLCCECCNSIGCLVSSLVTQIHFQLQAEKIGGALGRKLHVPKTSRSNFWPLYTLSTNYCGLLHPYCIDFVRKACSSNKGCPINLSGWQMGSRKACFFSGSPKSWNFVAILIILLWLMLHSEVGYILSSGKNGYLVQTLVAKVDYTVVIGWFGDWLGKTWLWYMYFLIFLHGKKYWRVKVS